MMGIQPRTNLLAKVHVHERSSAASSFRHRVDLPHGRRRFQEGRWSSFEVKPVAPIALSPAAHVLHYASTCFEGFKAFRHADGSVHVFRMDRHIGRMHQSARQLVLPEPDAGSSRNGARA